MPHPITIFLVRHGETEFNVKGIVQGHADSPLTENGIRQAEKLRNRFKDIAFNAAFASDLGRAIATAKIIVRGRDMTIETSKLIRERHYGRFEGKLSSEYQKEKDACMQQIGIMSNTEKLVFKFDPDVESSQEIFIRISSFLKNLYHAHAGKTILIVGHGGIMRAFLNNLGWGPDGYIKGGAIANGACIKFTIDNGNICIEETSGINEERIVKIQAGEV